MTIKTRFISQAIKYILMKWTFGNVTSQKESQVHKMRVKCLKHWKWWWVKPCKLTTFYSQISVFRWLIEIVFYCAGSRSSEISWWEYDLWELLFEIFYFFSDQRSFTKIKPQWNPRSKIKRTMKITKEKFHVAVM